MVDGKRVAVVVPAHNEEQLIATTLAGIPAFVDHVIVVDDNSTDDTASIATALGSDRIELVQRNENGGVGAAIVDGYWRALDAGDEVVCVMAADNQMDPADLLTLVEPVARGEVDYAKANRLVSGEAWKLIPRTRYLGNAILSLLTKIASGYWHVADSQTGYTAISRAMLAQLDLDRIYRGYGFPNDMLVHLNVWNARVRDFPSKPVYGVGEQSGIKLRRVVPRISWLLVKGFFWRLREKYVIRDFHPLVFFYALRAADDRRRPPPRRDRGDPAPEGERDHDADDRPRRAAPDLGQPVHALRDVVRHGVEQGPALDAGPSHASFTESLARAAECTRACSSRLESVGGGCATANIWYAKSRFQNRLPIWLAASSVRARRDSPSASGKGAGIPRHSRNRKPAPSNSLRSVEKVKSRVCVMSRMPRLP